MRIVLFLFCTIMNTTIKLYNDFVLPTKEIDYIWTNIYPPSQDASSVSWRMNASQLKGDPATDGLRPARHEVSEKKPPA